MYDTADGVPTQSAASDISDLSTGSTGQEATHTGGGLVGSEATTAPPIAASQPTPSTRPPTPSPLSKTLAEIEATIPAEIREGGCWCIWEYLWDEKTGRWKKLPQFSASGSRIKFFPLSVKNLERWIRFADLHHSITNGSLIGRNFGIGRLFVKGSGYVGIDLDGCLDQDGNLVEWAIPIVESLRGAYCEISPSGNGLKFWVCGSIPGKGRRLDWTGPNGEKFAIEVYDDGRFFTITGNAYWPPPTEIAALPDAIATIYVRTAGADKKSGGKANGSTTTTASTTPPTNPPVAVTLSDDEIIAKIRASKQGPEFIALNDRGDLSSYANDPSRADLAFARMLAFWFGGDVVRIERVQGQSALGQREKWINRADYREATIAKALEGMTEFYNPAYRSGGLATANGETAAGGGLGIRAFILSDTGNALRFVEDHIGKIRYCGSWGKWLVWDSQRWKEDTSGEVYRLARETIRGMRHEAFKIGDKDEMKIRLDWAKYAESRKGTESMIALARYVEGVPVAPTDLDNNPWLLCVANGVIDLTTGKLRPHEPDDLITKLADVDFEPDAKCPRWERFELEIMDNNPEMVGYLRRIAGYGLTGIIKEHELYFMHGGGRNGKSLWLAIVQTILGDYAATVNASLITSQRQDDHPTGLTDFEGRRFVSTVEVADGKKLAEAIVKQLTGGDPIRARRMRHDFYQFLPTHKIALAANHEPQIRGTDRAIWERVKFISFSVTFVNENEVDPAKKLLLKDKDLDNTLKAELPGILALFVRACLEWQANGMQEPSSVSKATAEYRGRQDDLAAFIGDRCTTLTGLRVATTTLYSAYSKWSELNGFHPMSGRKFGSEMESRGFILAKSNGSTYREGIGLTSPPHDPIDLSYLN